MNKKGQLVSTMTGAVRRGHINLDGMEKYPEANYWRSGAKWAKQEVYRLFGQDVPETNDRIEKILDKNMIFHV